MQITNKNISKVNGLKLANPNRALDFIERVNMDGGVINDYDETLNQTLQEIDGTESLVILPLATKTGKLYAPVPLDGSADVSVSRASEATYIDKDGVMQTAVVDEPRIDWSDGVAKFLFEGEGNNVFLHSNNFLNSYWYTLLTNVSVHPTIKAKDNVSDAYLVTGPDCLTRIDFNPKGVKSIWVRTLSGSGKITLLSHNEESDALFDINDVWQRVEFNNNPYVETYNNSYLVDFRHPDCNLTEVLICFSQNEPTTDSLVKATSYIPTNEVLVIRAADVVQPIDVPTGITKITEYFADGSINEITTIPTTYTLPFGQILKVKMTK